MASSVPVLQSPASLRKTETTLTSGLSRRTAATTGAGKNRHTVRYYSTDFFSPRSATLALALASVAWNPWGWERPRADFAIGGLGWLMAALEHVIGPAVGARSWRNDHLELGILRFR